jgi:heavy metal sensor kinase
MLSKILPNFRRSLVFRLTLLYACIFLVTSCFIFLLIYFLVDSDIKKRIDDELLNQMGTFRSIMTAKGDDAVRSVAILEAQAAGKRKIFFRICYTYTWDEWIYFSSEKAYWEDIGINRRAINQINDEKDRVFETIDMPDKTFKVRILYGSIGSGIILQIGASMEDHSRFLESFKNIFLITVAFLVAVAGAIGWIVAKQALSGLEEITQTAQMISDGEFEKRVAIKSRSSEIDLVGSAFNQMLDRIQLLHKGIKEFNDNLAHELRSPITSIRGSSEIALTTATSIDEYENMTAGTIEECDRLLDMINTMMVISKTEAGVSDHPVEEVNMSEVVKNACTLFQPLAEEKHITLISKIEDEYIFRGNIHMFQRMIANLLDNAIKYTDTFGEINVSFYRGEESIIISVKDTGMGIDEKDLPYIFNRFYRCDPSRSKPGMGLGLSLAKAIAKVHGGNIRAYSMPHKGSTFQITLPA